MKTTVPLVMIHGLMGSQHFYAPAAHIDIARVHTPDLIGYGQLAHKTHPPHERITLASQAASIIQYLREHVAEPCVLLGHSVGGAVAMLVAAAAPERVRALISVEGNFTLDDAFWCKHIASLSEDAWRETHARMIADPAAWLAQSAIAVSDERLRWAEATLHHQSAQTIRAMAQAVVAETGDARYLKAVRAVVDTGIAIGLIAGERSASGWNVPQWVRRATRYDTVQKGAGHMMMLEAPDIFCRLVSDAIAQLPVRSPNDRTAESARDIDGA
ncbi:alpha/beta hydrolase [Trinickia sp. LjRoot230]|uniref:alpha/beta fold hydrolase n=1 Tax=Trinickia sp. LjRoot230 TaxID=3342288 RepID=UPI003ECDFDE7